MPARRFPFKRSPGWAIRLVLSASLGIAAAIACDSPASASTITVTATDCQRLVRYQPSADVAYKPGVDVNGKPVAPADLPGSVTLKTPTEVTFDVTYDLLSNYGVSSDSVLAPRGEAVVGTVKYDMLSGALTFNGERLDDAETAALSELCKAAAAQ
jgi:hypothetical protein